MIHMILDCNRPTQSIVIQIIHRNVDLKCFFNLTKMFVCYYRYAFIFHLYLIYISQGSVKTRVRCGNIIITLLQIVHRVYQ